MSIFKKNNVTKETKKLPMSGNVKKGFRTYCALVLGCTFVMGMSVTAFAAGDVASAVESTWTTARTQIKTVVNNVVFPVLDLILAVFFFIKLGSSYFEYRKSGQFEWAGPAILFACLVFTLTAPTYLWSILGM